jgi:class 3 adenylate cyclase
VAAGAVAERRAGPASARKTFLFTDIVGSTALAELLGDEAWEHLLRWHDETLRAIMARAGGEVVNSTGDGFFVAFEDAGAALDAAIAVQRPAGRASANERGSDRRPHRPPYR